MRPQGGHNWAQFGCGETDTSKLAGRNSCMWLLKKLLLSPSRIEPNCPPIFCGMALLVVLYRVSSVSLLRLRDSALSRSVLVLERAFSSITSQSIRAHLDKPFVCVVVNGLKDPTPLLHNVVTQSKSCFSCVKPDTWNNSQKNICFEIRN